jgi:DNA-binding response OmpR family regulator
MARQGNGRLAATTGDDCEMTKDGVSCAGASSPSGDADRVGIGVLPDPVRLMVLDRDSELVQALIARGEQRGWEVHVLSNPTTRSLLTRMRLHALVVDPAILGPEPWDWVERVLAALPRLAVVVCASSSTVSERVRALQLGVDDWLGKPAHPEEVIARIESAVRRRWPPSAGARSREAIVAGELQIRFDERQAFVGEQSVQLTSREFGVLQAISEQRGAVARREAIYLQVWGSAMVDGDRSVDVHVRKIRRKLQRVSPRWSYIHTQFRIGYRFQPERVLDLDEPAA